MTHHPDRRGGVPPLVARHERHPAPSEKEIYEAYKEAEADILAARDEGTEPRISESAQRVLDHAAADTTRALIHSLLNPNSESHSAPSHGHEGGHETGGAHGAHGAHDAHGHDAHGHGDHSHGKTAPKDGNALTKIGGDIAGLGAAGGLAVGGAVTGGIGRFSNWVFGAPKRWLESIAANYGYGGDGHAKPKKKKDDHGHGGHGHDDHGGGHH